MSDARLVAELAALIEESQAAIIGPIRTETLSGIRDEVFFHRLRSRLRDFPDEPLALDDYELAASFYNICRAAGIQGSHGDMIIASAASRRGYAILTSDADFLRYARYLPIQLHEPRLTR